MTQQHDDLSATDASSPAPRKGVLTIPMNGLVIAAIVFTIISAALSATQMVTQRQQAADHEATLKMLEERLLKTEVELGALKKEMTLEREQDTANLASAREDLEKLLSAVNEVQVKSKISPTILEQVGRAQSPVAEPASLESGVTDLKVQQIKVVPTEIQIPASVIQHEQERQKK